jgi:hypothetical protein
MGFESLFLVFIIFLKFFTPCFIDSEFLTTLQGRVLQIMKIFRVL